MRLLYLCYIWKMYVFMMLSMLFHFIYTRIWPSNSRTSRCVQKAKWFWSFPWCGYESLVSWPSIFLEISQIQPSITPLKSYIRNPLDTLEGEELKSKKTIVRCCWSLYLSLHPFVPWSTLCSSQYFILLVSLLSRDGGLKWWRPKWGNQVSLIRKRVDRGCIHCNL